MPINIEIKARLEDLSTTRRLVEEIADQGPTELEQVDTYFRCSDGRLKLRQLVGGPAELIYYQRADVAGPRESIFSVTPVAEPRVLKQILTAAIGIIGTVTKKRLLFMVGQTRVHLDHVEGLGAFAELEVLLLPGQAADRGRAIARSLMEQLEIGDKQLVASSYLDLLDGSLR